MATRQSSRGPHDTHAERVVLAAGLYTADWWWEARQHHGPDDYFHVEHQAIARALDDLNDVDSLFPTESDWLDTWRGLWPTTPPTMLTVRVHAAATITDLPPEPLFAICGYADGLHDRSAQIVRAHSEKRHEILELRYRLRDLTE